MVDRVTDWSWLSVKITSRKNCGPSNHQWPKSSASNAATQTPGFAVAACKGRRQGKTVCEAQITYRVMAFPNPEFRKALVEWAERIDIPVKEFTKEPIK